MASISSPPEQGQLVTVRQRHFVVTEVAKSSLPSRPLKPSRDGTQHLITLSSVEDDALGEELQVVWELEPGAKTIDKVALPAKLATTGSPPRAWGIRLTQKCFRENCVHS